MNLTDEDLFEYLASRFNVAREGLAAETSLFSSGLVDSFAMVELIVFIEGKCDIKFKPSEINLDNIDSVSRILKFVESKEA